MEYPQLARRGAFGGPVTLADVLAALTDTLGRPPRHDEIAAALDAA